MQLFYTHYSLNSDTYNQRVHSEFLQQQQNPTKINDSNRATREEKKKKKKGFRFRYLFQSRFTPKLFWSKLIVPDAWRDYAHLRYNLMESQKT